MTRAYDDIEAVTRLLEEKEKDLELTVQIGKELLTQNNGLEARVSDLEADLKSANDDRAQLLHELHKKNELISVLTNDADEGNEAGEYTVIKYNYYRFNIRSLYRNPNHVQVHHTGSAAEEGELIAGREQIAKVRSDSTGASDRRGGGARAASDGGH